MSYKYLSYQNNLLESTFDFLNDSVQRKVQLFALVFGKKKVEEKNRPKLIDMLLKQCLPEFL